MKLLARGDSARLSPVSVDAGRGIGFPVGVGRKPVGDGRRWVVVSGELPLAVSVALVGGKGGHRRGWSGMRALAEASPDGCRRCCM